MFESSQHKLTEGKSCLTNLRAFCEGTIYRDGWEEGEHMPSALTSARLLTQSPVILPEQN